MSHRSLKERAMETPVFAPRAPHPTPGRHVVCGSTVERVARLHGRHALGWPPPRDCSAQRTRYVVTFVADSAPAVTLTLTLSSLPFAVFGTRNERRTVPWVNDWEYFNAVPATDG